MSEGLRCPRCNSPWSEVTRTMKVTNNRIRRYRQCRHCLKRFPTTEFVNNPDPGKKENDFYVIEEDEMDLD